MFVMRFVCRGLLLGLCCFFVSCGPKKVALKPANSPREVMVRVLDGIEKRDEVAVLELVNGTVEEQQLFARIINTLEACDVFKERFVKEYGLEAWVKFQGPNDEERGADFYFYEPDVEMLREGLESWKDNDEGRWVYTDLHGLNIQLMKLDSGWVIDGAKMFEYDDNLEKTSELMEAIVVLIEDHMEAIGHEGITADDIDYQMGSDFMKMLFGKKVDDEGLFNPDRYKVGDL